MKGLAEFVAVYVGSSSLVQQFWNQCNLIWESVVEQNGRKYFANLDYLMLKTKPYVFVFCESKRSEQKKWFALSRWI